MEEQFYKLWYSNKHTFWAHQIMNLIYLVFGVTYLFSKDSFIIGKYFIFCIYIAVCLGLEIWNIKARIAFMDEKIVGQFIYVSRIIVALAYYYMARNKLEGLPFLIMLILSSEEYIFRTALDNAVKRYTIYTLIAIVYGMLSVIMIVSLIQNKESRVTIDVGIREIAIVFAVLFVILFFGQVMAILWKFFEQRFLKQNRALEELNEANEALHEQQDKINLVNQKLGMQKIELQAANKRINRSHDELSVQNEISSAIAGSMKKEEMLNQIVQIMQVRLDMDVVAVILEEDNSLSVPGEEERGRFVAISTSMGESFEKNMLASIRNTDMKEMLSMNQTYIQNSQTDSVTLFEDLTDEQKLTSLICLPILNQDDRMGTLVIGKNRMNVFMDGRAFYENIANQIGIGISNARLYAKMNDMAIRDGLTRVYNRRYLTELLQKYLSEAIAKKMPLSLALFDIDKFKMVNDTYGHQCGDVVIRYVAGLLNKGAIRHGGIVGRYGGEEFVVVFLDKDLDEAYEIVKEIHEQIRSEEVVFEDKHIKVRASAGVASYPRTCENPGDLLTRADWAMYHSKTNGRDQITIDSDLIEDKM